MSCPGMDRKNRYRNICWILFLSLTLGMSVKALAASDAWAIERRIAWGRLSERGKEGKRHARLFTQPARSVKKDVPEGAPLFRP